jgi:hypothetical protein
MKQNDRDSILVGKTILEIYRSDDSERLKFVTDAGDVFFETDADCCSETWVEEILNADLLIGKRVVKCEDIEGALPTYPDSGRQEEDETYGWRIDSDGGTAQVIYRNASNGFYGGSLELDLSPDASEKWVKIA